MKKITAILLAAILAFTLCTPLLAYDANYTDKADILHEMGLFAGTDKGYELEKAPTRLEALIMLVRLLGKEKEAFGSTQPYPFTDVPPWAATYVSYAYHSGLSNGMSETEFGATLPCEARMYLTFILRALGYDDAKKDFTYNGAVKFASDISLIDAKYDRYLSVFTFLRDDMVMISYQALLQKMNNSTDCLLQQLVLQNAVHITDAEPYISIFLCEQLYLNSDNRQRALMSMDMSALELIKVSANFGTSTLSTEDNTKMQYRSNTDFDYMSTITGTINGRSEVLRTYIYTDGYLYYSDADGTKIKEAMTPEEFFGEGDTLVDFDADDSAAPELATAPMVDDRKPVIITKKPNGETIIEYSLEFSEEDIQEINKSVSEFLVNVSDLKEADVRDMTITITESSSIDCFTKDGLFLYSSMKYTVQTKWGKNVIVIERELIEKDNSPGKEVPFTLPALDGYEVGIVPQD